jgi:hypothetical protein
LQSLQLRFPSNYHETYVNHDDSHYSVGISPKLLVRGIPHESITFECWSKCIGQTPCGTQPNHQAEVAPLSTSAKHWSFCDRVGGRNFEQI